MRSGYKPLKHHEAAESFWNIVPPGSYDSNSAQSIIRQYVKVLEERLSVIISRHSIGYWLHAYRRLFPGPIGGNDSEATIYLVRSTFEAAVQKYATFDPCSGIAFSSSVEPAAVLKGLLMEPKLMGLHELLRLHPQLVLTDFDLANFKEVYDTERLAYQVWRCGAALRITAKGAGIEVDPRHPGGFFDTRSDDLDKLVLSYDSRQRELTASASATAFDPDWTRSKGRGIVLCAQYNIGSETISDFKKLFASFGLELDDGFKPNFLWAPFNLGEYLRAHEPFSGAFQNKHGIPLSWVFAV
jgi:hypothetical protein